MNKCTRICAMNDPDKGCLLGLGDNCTVGPDKEYQRPAPSESGSLREKLAQLLDEAENHYLETVSGAESDSERYKIIQDSYGVFADHLIANGVTVQRERELVCVTKTGPSEAVYFRKIYFCPSCDTEIGDELLDVNTERVFGHGTVMKNNKFPKCCPECGTRIVMPQPPKGE